ncbi:hypothetical protein FDUTEX481_02030 [Tolypothrix sp. PCC 7601]|nr:hypothetical protein FDUTEX481_02030 [Tolypothrix sp. PCC 7601]BAY90800.1 hypothetical protein NIES3275_28170 [Microchaete diplosiphon NIES-3275]
MNPLPFPQILAYSNVKKDVGKIAHGERGARDLVPLLLREKGLGDEGARYLYNARPI